MAQMVARTMHLAKIFRWEPTHMGFCDASGIGEGGVWMNPYRSGASLVWRHPWPPNIIAAIIPDRNPEGTLTNSDLEITALVLHEATLLDTCSEAKMAAP